MASTAGPSARSGASRWFPLAIAVLGFVVISPALWSGWLADDAFYSALDGVLKADRISLGQAMLRSFHLWFFNNGRFYPGLIVEKYLVFYLFTNLIAYKAFLIAATLGTIELFRRCVSTYVNTETGNLCALIVVTLLAERGYHDSILAYNGMPQFVMLAMLASILAFRRGLVEKNHVSRVAAILLYAVAALTYEDVYLLCLLYPAIGLLLGRERSEVVKASMPYVLIASALTIFALAMRHAVRVSPDSIYAFGSDPSKILQTGADQIVAALPLSYWLFDPSGIFSRSSVQDFLGNAPLSPAVFIVFALAAWWCIGEVRRHSVRLAPLIWIGTMVLVLAALPIAVTVKYQHELKLGLGYLPVFFEVFGTAIIGCVLATWIVRRYPRAGAQLILCVVIAVCATMTQATNVRLVREGMASRDARAALARQLAGGLLTSVHDGEAIAVAQDFDWIAYDDDGPDGISTRGLFSLYGDRRITLVPLNSAAAHYILVYDRRRSVWTMNAVSSYR
jgi:hypothetical protein